MSISNLFPMTPAQSWALIGMLAACCALITYTIWYLDRSIQLAIWNAKIAGFKGVLLAFVGEEFFEVRKEQVIEVVRQKEFGYRAITTDGENNYEYQIITSSVDEESPAYRDAIQLAGDDEHLKMALLPDHRVKKYFRLEDHRDGSETEFFVVYVKTDNAKSVEDALNEYFEKEFRKELLEARKTGKQVA